MPPLLRCCFLLVGCTVLSTSSLAVEGSWSGSYTCPQGLTGVTLIIEKTGDRTNLSARFCFCAIPENPTLPTGEFELDGSVALGSGAVHFTPRRWIRQPTPTWYMIPLDLTPSADGRSMTGSVDAPGCHSIELTRSMDKATLPRCQCRGAPIS